MKIFWFLGLIVIIIFYYGSVAAESDHVLPPVEEDKEHLSSVEKIFVRQFKLEGNTVFSNEELAPILAPYENREITAEEMQETKDKLTRFYINHGYMNSGAIIRDQKLENSEIVINIIEGVLSDIEFSGNTWLRTSYIHKRLKLAMEQHKGPLNINFLQERLKLLKQDPRIENINATLSPGLELGQANLNVEIQEARPYHLNFKFNNYNSPSIGAYRGEINFGHKNLTGWGDTLNAQYALSEGLDDYSVDYTIPITRWDTILGIRADRSESTVVTSPFNDLDIRSETTTYSASLRHPFYKSLFTEFAMGLKIEKRYSETYVLDEKFPFPGSGADENGETDFMVYRFTQEWVKRSTAQVTAIYASLNFGDVDGGEFDGGFVSWLGQFQWLRQMPPLGAGLFNNPWENQVIFAVNLQLSNDSLVSAEKFAVGGSYTVRGYRENQLTTDNGLTASLEWRVNVANLKIPGLSKKSNDGALQLCPFLNFGKGWNTDLADPDPDTIYSAGLGLRWLISEKIYTELYWGKALKDVPDASDYDIQDDGIHFQITLGIF